MKQYCEWIFVQIHIVENMIKEKENIIINCVMYRIIIIKSTVF